MSDKNLKSETPSPVLHEPENQKQRWVKYGANVALTSVIVIVIAAVLTYIAQAHARRIDTTVGGAQSLRPQTVNVIKDLKQKVRVVAIYTKLKNETGQQDFYQPVADLLSDYASKGSNITTEIIDPDIEKEKLNKLIAEVTNTYGGEVKNYKALLTDELPGINEKIKALANDEARKFKDLPLDEVQDQELQQQLYLGVYSLVTIPKQVDRLKDLVDSDLSQQIPSYKEAADDVRKTYSNISKLLELYSSVLESAKANEKVPQAIRDYAPDGEKRAADARKIADDMVGRIEHLGELKQLDEFRDQLKSSSIIVMTDSGYKILQKEQIWTSPQRNPFAQGTDSKPRLRFAGEQQISMAIASLTMPKKQMIVFVRPGGPPLTASMGRGQSIFSTVATRLREYNFDVQEKDASGQWAAQQQQQMPTPEPTDDQLKTAIWVVIRFAEEAQMGPSPLDAMLQKHLADGGSAMVLLYPQADAMTATLAPWGITAKTDFMLVKEPQAASPRKSNDQVEVLQRNFQPIFLLNQYGKHPLTEPLQGLDFLLAFALPVVPDDKPPAGVTVTPLLPVPQSPHSWAAKDAARDFDPSGEKLKFKPGVDLDNTQAKPLYNAAAIEKSGGGRLIVVGGWTFAIDPLVTMPDTEQADQNISRLPGNGEFFTDGIFWLSHSDALLAISPHSLEVPRIAAMSPATQNFWRVGVLMAGLPAAVVVAGLLVYSSRRD